MIDSRGLSVLQVLLLHMNDITVYVTNKLISF